MTGDTRYKVNEPAQPTMYFPIYAGRNNEAALVVRSSGDVIQLALPIQRLVGRLNRELSVSDVLTMDQLIGKSTVDARFDAALLLAFAAVSLILAAVGLFGVLSYIAAQRSMEISIRMALGAPRESVFRLVLLDGLRPAFVGLGLGMIASIGSGRIMQSILYGVKPFDMFVLLSITAMLLVVSGAACVIPAWRASRLNPIAALRLE